MTDPTNTIATAEQAQVLAHVMLRLAPEPADSTSQAVGAPLLGVLLHSASPCGRGGGLAWVRDTVGTLATHNADLSALVGVADTDSAALSEFYRLGSAQRRCVISTVGAAVAPWTQAQP